MRIALAVFGIPRGASLTFAPLMKNVVAQAGKAGDVALFGHFYDVREIDNSRSGEHGTLGAENFLAFADFNIRTEAPGECLAAYDLAAIRSHGDYYGDDFRSVNNLVHQLHALKMVSERIRLHDPDVVLFVRPDLFYHDPFPAWMIADAARHPDRCYLPHWQWWGGYNDRFAICGRKAFLHYGSRIDHILDYCSRGHRPLHAERLLRETMRAGGIRLRHLPVRASRVRLGDLVKTENFDARATIGPRRLLPEMALSHLLTRLHL